MLPEGTIAAREVWKRFRPDRGRNLLRDELHRMRARVTGKEADWRWALREVDLHAEPGTSVGLIGVNGSGKSTFLKILTRVMDPTAGSVQVRGRVGALIEVRAGIHPDLTGRENIYLYGSLIGLGRRQVAERFDQIVAFAELDDAIDRQLKFYSSGMAMRLGFGVAAFLNPDVLLVDEVLAVGDAIFQQRCLDRMREVLSAGTTLVLVSHDLAAVEATCEQGVWLHDGRVLARGPIKEVLASYRAAIEATTEVAQRAGGPVRVVSAEVTAPDGGLIKSEEAIEIRAVVETDDATVGRIFFGVSQGPATPTFVVDRRVQLGAGRNEVRCRIDRLPLPRGRFFVWAAMDSLRGGGATELLPWHPTCHFDVFGPELDATPVAVVRLAPVYVSSSWEVESADANATSAGPLIGHETTR